MLTSVWYIFGSKLSKFKKKEELGHIYSTLSFVILLPAFRLIEMADIGPSLDNMINIFLHLKTNVCYIHVYLPSHKFYYKATWKAYTHSFIWIMSGKIWFTRWVGKIDAVYKLLKGQIKSFLLPNGPERCLINLVIWDLLWLF